MSLSALVLLPIVAVLWWLMHMKMLPRMQQRWKAETLRGKMARAGALSVAEKLRDLAGAGAVALGFMLALVALAGWLAESDEAVPKAVLDTVSGLQSWLKALADGWGSTVTWIGLAGAGGVLWMAARRARQRVGEVWGAAASQAFQDLRNDSARIEAARADPALAPLVDQLDEALDAAIAARQAAQDETLQPDGSTAEPSPAQAAAAAAQQRVGEALSALAIGVAGQGLDFPAAAGRATAAEAAEKPGRWRRLMRILASKRLGEDLGLVSTWLGRAATALLFVSLTGWAATPLADSLRLSVNNLRVQAHAADVQREFDQALSQTPDEPPLQATSDTASPQATQRAAQLLARAAMRQMARSPLLDHAASVERSTAARSEFVRAALAGEHLDAGSGTAADAVRTEAAKRDAGKAAAEAEAEAARTSPAARRAVELAEPTMTALRQRDPGRFAALLERLEARYSANAMGVSDAQGKLIGKMVDGAFGAVDAATEGELGKQAQKLTKDFGKKSVKTWADAQVKEVIAKALRGAAQGDVASRMPAFVASDDARDFVRALAEREGRGWSLNAQAKEEDAIARKVSDAVGELHADAKRPEMRTAAAGRVRGYEHLFQRDEGPLPPDAADGRNPGAGGSGGGGTKPHATARASNFHWASRSFRVRGVLFGREITGAALDATDLRWRIEPPAAAAPVGTATRVALELRVAPGPARPPFGARRAASMPVF